MAVSRASNNPGTGHVQHRERHAGRRAANPARGTTAAPPTTAVRSTPALAQRDSPEEHPAQGGHVWRGRDRGLAATATCFSP